MKPTVYLATDHAGFALKNAVKAYLENELSYPVVDCGAHDYNGEDDYPDFIAKAAESIKNEPQNRAIIFGGSGQGEAMVANKYAGVRATVYYGGSAEIITLSREHNDANALSLGARFVTEDEAYQVVSTWLAAPFSNEERHQRRLDAFRTLGA